MLTFSLALVKILSEPMKRSLSQPQTNGNIHFTKFIPADGKQIRISRQRIRSLIQAVKKKKKNPMNKRRGGGQAGHFEEDRKRREREDTARLEWR